MKILIVLIVSEVELHPKTDDKCMICDWLTQCPRVNQTVISCTLCPFNAFEDKVTYDEAQRIIESLDKAREEYYETIIFQGRSNKQSNKS